MMRRHLRQRGTGVALRQHPSERGFTLAELLAVPVMDCSRTNRMNFPFSHPLYGTGPRPQDADVILVFEAVVPFTPSSARLSAFW